MRTRTRQTTTEIAASDPRGEWLVLAVIILVAALLRAVRIGIAPPGLNQDEAVNAWNAWCLLRTGTDMTGQSWPVFYSHAIGDNRTTLFFYALMPFQLLGGLSVLTTRAPAVVAGLACVPLVYVIGNRLLGRPAGLFAAWFMALEPWPLFMSRWGIEGSLCPLLALLPLALLLAAQMPLADGPRRPADVICATLAGLAAGVACYGYWAMRLHLPLMFLALVLVAPRRWWAMLREARGRTAVAAGLGAFLLTFGPLVWRHATDPAIGRRAEMTRLWDATTPPLEIASRVAGRYLQHFGPDFLFQHGDRFDIVKPIGGGEFNWPLSVFMLVGLVTLMWTARRSVAARAVLALVLVYPTGDLVSQYLGPHAMRSAPGIGALVLLAAAGAAAAWRWAGRSTRLPGRIARVLVVVVLLAIQARYLVRFFGENDRRPAVYHGYMTDLLEATRWLKPHLAGADAVYCTTAGMNEPFAVVLVGLGEDPVRWKQGPREVRQAGDWDVYVRSGAWRFLYGDVWASEVDSLQRDGRPEHAFFVVRPGAYGLKSPVHVVRAPDGREVLWVCAVDL